MPLHTRIPLTERLAITPRTHAWLDYLTAVPLMVLPRMLGARPGVQKAAAAMAAAQVGYAALTDHPGGVCPVIPMEAHRAIDIVAGSTLIALPFLLDEEDPGGDGDADRAGGVLHRGRGDHADEGCAARPGDGDADG